MWKTIYLLLFLSFIVYCQSQVSPTNTQVVFKFSQFGTVAGNPIIANIIPQDANNQTITGCSLGTNPFQASPTPGLTIKYPTACQPGVEFPYVITLVSNIAANYSVSFTYQNQLIGDSPYTIGYTFGPISANNSIVSGLGKTEANVGINATITFLTYDQHGNLVENCMDPSEWAQSFSIILMQPIPITGNIIKCDPTTYQYTANYMTTTTDSGFLYVQYLGNSFSQMPTLPIIYSGDPYGPTCLIPAATDNNRTAAGEEATIGVECVDVYGNTLSDCSRFSLGDWNSIFNTTASTHTFSADDVTCANPGIFTFTYTDIHAALYNTYFYYKSADNLVPPFTTLITPGKATDIVAIGPGTEEDTSNIAGIPVPFSVYASDQYSNPISECLDAIDSDWNISTIPEMPVKPYAPICVNNTMVSNWTATDANQIYFLSVYYTGKRALGSPYLTKVYSNVLDANLTVLLPLNQTSIGAGEYLSFNIDGYDVYGNEITNCSRVTSTFSAVATNLKNNSIVITGDVSCTQLEKSVLIGGFVYGTLIGEYNLTVFYNNVQIKNSPRTFNVTPGPMSPPMSYATGFGFTNTSTAVVAGTINPFFIHQRDQYGNDISTCLPSDYSWNVIVDLYPPLRFASNLTYTDAFCDEKGVYTIPLNVTVVGYFQIIVYSVYQNDYSSEIGIQNNGSIHVIPGPFSPLTSKVDVQPLGYIGQRIGVKVSAFDVYGNAITNCSSAVSNNLEIFASSGGILISASLDCEDDETPYDGFYIPQVPGIYNVYVDYYINGFPVLVGQPGSTNVTYGVFSTKFSTATGPGVGLPVGSTVVAGTSGVIYIMTKNVYGSSIPADSVNSQSFTFNVTGLTNPVYYNNTVFAGISPLGDLQFNYNATVAQDYSVIVLYNDEPLFAENGYYQATVVPNVIDINTLKASNISQDNTGTGTFDLSATDAFNNTVYLDGLEATLSPSCSFPNVSCYPTTEEYMSCDYTVQQAGVYCITVLNTSSLVEYSVADSTILIDGGAGCNDDEYCSGNGVCYQVLNSNKYQCNCKNGYTGSDCSTKIKSHYMNLWLGVGLLIGLSILLLIIGVVLGCLLGRRNRATKNLLN